MNERDEQTGNRDPVHGDAAELADVVLSLARKITVHDRANGIDILSPVDTLVIRVIDARPGISPSGVAAEVGLASSNASAAIRRLESKGLVDRHPDPDDARSTHLRSTEKSRRTVEQVRRGWAGLLSPLLADGPALASTVELLRGLDEDLDVAYREGAMNRVDGDGAHA